MFRLGPPREAVGLGQISMNRWAGRRDQTLLFIGIEETQKVETTPMASSARYGHASGS
jgi:hypothetical protein